MKNKILLSLFVLFNIVLTSVAIDLSDVKSPKDKFYRLGTTDIPEIKYQYDVQPTIKPIVQKEDITNVNTEITYADLSIKKMSLEISKTLDLDYNDMLQDLSLLWQGAATGSDTIKFAIYKLSNPDKDKPDSGAVKKVLSTIAGMSTLIGAGTGNPVLASAALIGGNTLGIMSTDTKALNYKYSQVTDADMIILVRKIEDLQQKVVDMYYDYITARELYNMSAEMVAKCKKNYENAQNKNREVILITDTFYRNALDEQQKVQGSFFEKRSRLEQLVGNEIFVEFEKNIDSRYAKQK